MTLTKGFAQNPPKTQVRLSANTIQSPEPDLQTPKPTPRTQFGRFLDDEFGELSHSKVIERAQEVQAIREIDLPYFDAQEVEAWFMFAESNVVVFDV